MAKAKVNPTTFDRREWIPLTDILRRILPRFETCAEACREVEQAIHSGHVRLHLQQGHFPDFAAAPPLPPGADWIKRIRIEWSGEDERAEIWSAELLEQYKKLRPGNVAYRDFWSTYLHRQDVDRLLDRFINQVAKPARRKPGPKPFDWRGFDAELLRRVTKNDRKIPDNDTKLAAQMAEFCTEKWGYDAPKERAVRARIRQVLAPMRKASK